MRYGDNGLAVDFDQMALAVDDGDIVVVGFEMTSKRLVIDLRPDDHSPPLLEIADPVGGADERNAWLSERRPGVALPEKFVYFTWPHSIEMLGQSPLFERTHARIEREQGLDVAEEIGELIDRPLPARARRSPTGAYGRRGLRDGLEPGRQLTVGTLTHPWPCPCEAGAAPTPTRGA